jgi:ubiquinone/menaquinone biosynthesis C-methylase UbiE
MSLDFSTKEYWEKKYAEKDTTFEWLENYEELRDYIREHISRESQILIPGCGNSTLGVEMHKDGYDNIEQFDFSDVVVEQMSRRYPELIWKVMDMKNMTYEDGTFDVVLDKGALDAFTCGGDVDANIRRACEEYTRVLKPGCMAYIVSFGQSPERLEYFNPADPVPWIYEGFDLLPREIAPHCYFHVYKLRRSA